MNKHIKSTSEERRLTITNKFAMDSRAKAKLAMLTNTDPQ